VVPPGVRVRVHVPDAGKPLNATLPVGVVQVGWVRVPTVGAPGVTGCALITTAEDAGEVQLSEFFTVNV
jgi:hypothetical protein